MKFFLRSAFIIIFFLIIQNIESQTLLKDSLKESTSTLNPSVSLSGGLGILTSYYLNNIHSYNFLLEGTTYFSRTNGLRAKINLNFFRMRNDLNQSPGYSTEGGNLFLHLFTVDMLIGSFEPEKKFSHYFEIGGGLILAGETQRTDHTPTATYTYEGSHTTEFGISLGYGFMGRFPKINFGAEINYSCMPRYYQLGIVNINPKITYIVSKNLGIFLEPEYLFPVSFAGQGYFGINEGYFSIRAGITLSKF